MERDSIGVDSQAKAYSICPKINNFLFFRKAKEIGRTIYHHIFSFQDGYLLDLVVINCMHL